MIDDHAAMEYEWALRFVFKEDRFGADDYADADLFRGAVSRGDWSEVKKGLTKALDKISEELISVPWKGVHMQQGGEQINLNVHIEKAKERLNKGGNEPELYATISNLITCLSAIMRASTGDTRFIATIIAKARFAGLCT